jgi:hypothetical protein
VKLQFHVHVGGYNLLGYFELGVKKSAKYRNAGFREKQAQKKKVSVGSRLTVAYD